MTEFNPLLKKTQIQNSLTDSSEQEDDCSKPLLRKKVISTNDQIRYRPKSMSTISRSNYSSSEFRNSTMSSSTTITQSVTSSQSSTVVKTRPQSYAETSTQKVQVSEMKAEKFFIKSVNFSSNSKSLKSASSSSIPVLRPISSSEPLYIQDIPSDSIPPAPVEMKEVKIEVKESIPPIIVRPLTPPPLLTESSRNSSVETKEQLQTNQMVRSSSEETDSSSETSDSSSDSEHASDDVDDDTLTSPVQQQGISDLHYSSIIPGEESTIEINRGLSELGINIIGGADTLLVSVDLEDRMVNFTDPLCKSQVLIQNSVHILTVSDQGAATKDGRLWPGDQILFVNGRDLRHSTHEEAVEIVRNSPPQVRMVILRDGEKSKRFLKYQRKSKLPLFSYWESINNEKESDIYDLYEVELKRKGNQSLGLCIIGRRNDPGVFVTEVTPGGVAEGHGGIQKGDQILAINGKDVKIAGQEAAAELVKEANGKIHLRMGRLKSGIPDDLMDMPIVEKDRKLSNESGPRMNSFDREKKKTRFVEIAKPYNTSLGIFIAGGAGSPLGDVPVFVAMVEETNVVGEKLKIGDMIVSVNGQTTGNKTHDDVVSMMSTEEDMIILMQVQEPTEEIQKLSTFLTQAVNKNKKKTVKLERKKSLERQRHVNEFSPTQTDTLVF